MIIKDICELAIQVAQGNPIYYKAPTNRVYVLDFPVKISNDREALTWHQLAGAFRINLAPVFRENRLATTQADHYPKLKRGLQFRVNQTSSAVKDAFWMVVGYDGDNYICQWYNIPSFSQNNTEFTPGVKAVFDATGRGLRRCDNGEPCGHNIDFTQIWEPR